jgi:hypothetical protein
MIEFRLLALISESLRQQRRQQSTSHSESLRVTKAFLLCTLYPNAPRVYQHFQCTCTWYMQPSTVFNSFSYLRLSPSKSSLLHLLLILHITSPPHHLSSTTPLPPLLLRLLLFLLLLLHLLFFLLVLLLLHKSSSTLLRHRHRSHLTSPRSPPRTTHYPHTLHTLTSTNATLLPKPHLNHASERPSGSVAANLPALLPWTAAIPAGVSRYEISILLL